MLVPRLEKSLGMQVYATKSSGIGGAIRRHAKDFLVEEILVDGSMARVNHLNGQVSPSSVVEKSYLLCNLVKCNWDTFLALKAVSKQLGISLNRIQIAGIKDAKAVTAQHITIERTVAEEIEKVTVRNIKLHPIGYFRNKLSPYYLLGNRFRITVRAIDLPRCTVISRIMKIIEESKTMHGVPNFFGHQRFGTIRPITHLVGKAIVQGNFERAAMLYLAEPSRNEHPESRKAREHLQRTQNFKRALKIFPKQLHYERWMLGHLVKEPEDFVGAFRRLPLKLRKLFPQAYQAFLFNKFLSTRIQKKLPLNRVEFGDYVLHVERSGLPMLRTRRMASNERISEINAAIQAGKIRLAMPIIGVRQHPSQGRQGEIEKKILEEEKIDMANFRIQKMPEISLKGTMRTAIAPLKDFLLEETSKDESTQSKHKIRISLTLYRGSYATTVLRELMKPRNIIEAGF